MRLLSATMATRANPGGKSMCGLKFPPPQYLNAIYISNTLSDFLRNVQKSCLQK